MLLHRTPYDKSEAATVAIAETLAKHGYVVMVQDTRGRHHSQGVFEKYYCYDAYDGYDTVEWAAKQPFCDGKVGMYGTSYAAHTQADASKLAPPHLRALLLNMGGMSNAWDHSVRYDGAFEMGRQLTWAWSQALDDAKGSSREGHALQGGCQRLVFGAADPQGIEPACRLRRISNATTSTKRPTRTMTRHWDTLGMQWEKFYARQPMCR